MTESDFTTVRVSKPLRDRLREKAEKCKMSIGRLIEFFLAHEKFPEEVTRAHVPVAVWDDHLSVSQLRLSRGRNYDGVPVGVLTEGRKGYRKRVFSEDYHV